MQKRKNKSLGRIFHFFNRKIRYGNLNLLCRLQFNVREYKKCAIERKQKKKQIVIHPIKKEKFETRNIVNTWQLESIFTLLSHCLRFSSVSSKLIASAMCNYNIGTVYTKFLQIVNNQRQNNKNCYRRVKEQFYFFNCIFPQRFCLPDVSPP